jgi:hypothetical protein
MSLLGRPLPSLRGFPIVPQKVSQTIKKSIFNEKRVARLSSIAEKNDAIRREIENAIRIEIENAPIINPNNNADIIENFNQNLGGDTRPEPQTILNCAMYSIQILGTIFYQLGKGLISFSKPLLKLIITIVQIFLTCLYHLINIPVIGPILGVIILMVMYTNPWGKWFLTTLLNFVLKISGYGEISMSMYNSTMSAINNTLQTGIVAAENMEKIAEFVGTFNETVTTLVTSSVSSAVTSSLMGKITNLFAQNNIFTQEVVDQALQLMTTANAAEVKDLANLLANQQPLLELIPQLQTQIVAIQSATAPNMIQIGSNAFTNIVTTTFTAALSNPTVLKILGDVIPIPQGLQAIRNGGNKFNSRKKNKTRKTNRRKTNRRKTNRRKTNRRKTNRRK